MITTPALRRGALAAGASLIALLAPTAAQAQSTAQAGQAAEESGIETIIVTAQRQAESLQDVPIAVSAFTTEALERQSINNTLDLQQALPNVTFTKGNFTGSNLTVRGIGAPVVATSSDQGVAVHFNDMPLVSPRIFETEFYDLERLEVLRGPQGTLFGRNATGGVLNLITAKPKKEFEAAGEFQYGNYESIQVKGMVNVPLGEIGAIRVAGLYLNRDGFTENLFTGNDIDGRDNYSLRGSLLLEPTEDTTFTLTAQYFKEDSNRSRIQKQLCAQDPTGILGCRPDKLGNQATNGDATLASIITSREFLTIAGAGALAPFALGSIYSDDGNAFSNAVNPTDVRQVSIDYEPTYLSDELIIQGELSHDFENFTVTLNGGYSDNKVDSRTDYNLTVTNDITNNPGLVALRGAAAAGVPIAQLFASQALFSGNQICVSEANRNYVGFTNGEIDRCANNTTEFDRSRETNEQWSVEARINSSFDGPFNFLLGGLYLEREAESDYYLNASGLDYGGLLLGGGAGVLASPYFNSETDFFKLKSYGVFGEAYYEFTDTLKLTVGARWSKDEKFVRDRSPLYANVIPFGTTDANPFLAQVDQDFERDGVQAYREASANFDEVTGRVVLDWKPVLSFTEDTLVYASYSRGYKPGGINPPINPSIFTAPSTFDSEIVNAFEVGTKNVVAGGVAQINLTGFYYDYKDLQVSRIINRTSFNDNTDATVWGLELETVFSPGNGFTANASLSYLNTEIKGLQLVDTRDPSGGRDDVVIIKDVTNASNCAVIPTVQGSIPIANTAALVAGFNNAASGGLLRAPVAVPGTNALGAYSICAALAGFLESVAPGAYLLDPQAVGTNLPAGVTLDLSGNELLNSPNWKFSVGAQWAFSLSSGWTITPRADINFTGDAFGTNFNTARDKLEAYEIVNAQITVASPDERYYLRGYVSNAFDTQAVTGMYNTDPSSGLFTNIFTVEPRQYGLAIGARF